MSKVSQVTTNFPPSDKPMVIWDGKCGFCHYWVIKWKKWSSKAVDYAPFQKAASNYPDLEISRFQNAVQLIEKDGKVYSGAAVPYRIMQLSGRSNMFFNWYRSLALFRWFNDTVYQWIANHRNFMYRLSVAIWGKNPARPKWGWLAYLLLGLGISIAASLILSYSY